MGTCPCAKSSLRVRRETSAVGFLAIADTNDFESVFPDAEKDPMILRAESELRRIDAGH
jgi:hypothetical protein